MNRKIMNLVLMIMLIILCICGSEVNASDLSNKITTNVKDLFGESGKVETKYNATNDVTNMQITVTIDANTIDKVLSQVPGVDANSRLSYSYLMIKPDLNYSTYYKQNTFFDNKVNTTMDDMKAKVSSLITDSDLSDNNTVWGIAMYVEYSLDGGKTWSKSQTVGDAKTSVKEDLVSKFSGKTFNDLVYGKDYRFGMYEKYNWLFLWQDKKTDPSSKEWIQVSYKIEFPVTETLENGDKVYYPSIEEAIKGGAKTITIFDDISLTNDIEIEEDMTLIIEEGTTLNIKDKKIINNGKIDNRGTIIDNNNNKYYTIETKGEASVLNNLVKVGDTVKISYPSKKGFNIILVVKNTKTDDTISTVNDEFKMPEANVTIDNIYNACDVLFISGEKATYNNKDLVFKIDMDYKLFDKLYINDKEVDKKYYEVTEGSTVITLKKDYLDTLDNNEYTLKATFTNGSNATTTFTVNKENIVTEENKEKTEKEEKNPKTLDMLGIYSIIGIISLMGIGLTSYYIKKAN